MKPMSSLLLLGFVVCLGIARAGEEIQLQNQPSLTAGQEAYLKEQGEKIGIRCQDASEWQLLFGASKCGADEDQQRKELLLEKEIWFCLYSNVVPTKDNLLKAIALPEKRSDMHWPQTAFRSCALSLLAASDGFGPGDLAAVQQSFLTAVHWESKIAAICAITKINHDLGMQMAWDYRSSRNEPLAAKIALLKSLRGLGVKINYSDWTEVLAEAANCPNIIARNEVLEVLNDLADAGGHESQRRIDEILEKAEKRNREINEQFAEIKGEHQRHVKTEAEAKEEKERIEKMRREWLQKHPQERAD